MYTKQDFLELNLSERSLERKLSEIGLSSQELETNLTAEQEETVEALYVGLKKHTEQLVSQGKELTTPEVTKFRNSRNLNNAIASLKSNYLIIMDTCSLVCEGSTAFLYSLETALIRYQKKVTIVGWVYKELERLRTRLLTENPRKSKRIKKNLDILYRMFDNGLVTQSIETDKDEFKSYGLADLEIFEVFNHESNHYKQYRDILIITQDKNLQLDLLMRFMRFSVLPQGNDKEILKRLSIVARVNESKGGDDYQEVIHCDNFEISLSDKRFKSYLREQLSSFANMILSDKLTGDKKVRFKLRKN